MPHLDATDDLDDLLEALPPEVVERVRALGSREDLLEIVLDLGRRPEARFTHTEEVLLEREVTERDRQLDHDYGKDLQIAAIRQARNYRGDQLVRTAKLHKILDPKAGPLIGVKLNILTRKTLGGFETDLDGRVFGTSGAVVPGLYAAGEVAGFGGGGVHGYRALEGSFLGGCIFSGRAAGRAAARDV